MPKDTKFQPGVSGNPTGRPKDSENKLISDRNLKKKLKQYGPEAIDNIVTYMKEAKVLSGKYKNEVSKLQDDLESLEELAEQIECLTKINGLLSRASKEDEKIFKASIKIVDTAYNVVIHDDKMKIKKKESGEGFQEEDLITPVVSLKAI